MLHTSGAMTANSPKGIESGPSYGSASTHLLGQCLTIISDMCEAYSVDISRHLYHVGWSPKSHFRAAEDHIHVVKTYTTPRPSTYYDVMHYNVWCTQYFPNNFWPCFSLRHLCLVNGTDVTSILRVVLMEKTATFWFSLIVCIIICTSWWKIHHCAIALDSHGYDWLRHCASCTEAFFLACNSWLMRLSCHPECICTCTGRNL